MNNSSERLYKHTILIVDDEAGLREILRDEFELLGWKVFDAAGGNEAFALLQKNPVEIVLSDVRMPFGDGVQLLEYIKKSISPSPIIFMVTGFADVSDVDLKALGARAVINKPYDLDELIKLVADSVADPTGLSNS